MNSQLTPTQTTILQAAATRPDGAIHPLPKGLQGGAALKVIGALQAKGLIRDEGNNDWRISDEGYQAIGREPPTVQEPKEVTDLDGLIEKIALDHLDIVTLETREPGLPHAYTIPVRQLKRALEAAYQAGAASASKQRKRAAKPAKEGGRRETKQAHMIELLKRPEGATVEQLAVATGWNANTVRGAIAGTLKKRLGLTITTERLRVVGPGQQGSPGSYTTYRILEKGGA